MALSGWQWLTALLLASGLTSFAWGMRKFFVQPSGSTSGMKLISGCGFAFAVLHFAAILWRDSVTEERAFVAGLLYVWSLGLFWWAISANSATRLSAIFSDDVPVHLVDKGPYRFIRHPFYSAYLLAWMAGPIATARWWLIPTVVVMAVIYWKAAASEEEKFSRSSLAAEYQSYRARTPLLVPNPMRLLLARRSEQ